MGRFFSKLADETKKKKPQTWDINDVPMSMAPPKGKLPPAQQKEQKDMDSRFKHLMEKEEARKLAAQPCKKCGKNVPVSFGMQLCDGCLLAESGKYDKAYEEAGKSDAAQLAKDKAMGLSEDDIEETPREMGWVDSKGRP
jgi:hypothetical protein